MKNRTSSHVFILALIVAMTAVSHYSIYYGGLIRGYETSPLTAFRNIALLSILAVIPIFLKKFARFQGNWTIYPSAALYPGELLRREKADDGPAAHASVAGRPLRRDAASA